jgi:hypothetical protein
MIRSVSGSDIYTQLPIIHVNISGNFTQLGPSHQQTTFDTLFASQSSPVVAGHP